MTSKKKQLKLPDRGIIIFQGIRFLSLFVILFAVAACIDLEPDTAVNPVGKEHTITATVASDAGPILGVLVTFEVISGPNTGVMSNPNRLSKRLYHRRNWRSNMELFEQ